MERDEKDDMTVYKVVLNHEEQYSIWPVDRPNPLGWNDAGKQGLKAECLAHINEVWTDMRPLSLRKSMEEDARRRAQEKEPPPTEGAVDTTPSLVDRLCQGEHLVEASLRPEKSLSLLKKCLDRGYVHIKFTGTRGGTELGVRLEPDRTDLRNADLDKGIGKIHLVGTLTLDYRPVRCVADIDLATLAGTGHLEPREEASAEAS